MGRKVHRRLAAVAQRNGDFFAHGLLCRRQVEFEFAAHKRTIANPAQDQVGIGHRRLGATSAKGHRARLRARTAGAHGQLAVHIDRGNGATARTHLHDVKHRRFERKAALIAAHIVNRLYVVASVHHQRTLGGGAAHVKSNDVVATHGLGIRRRTDTPSNRTGFHQGHRLLHRALHRQHAAVGAHHVEFAFKALAPQPLLKALQIAAHARPDIGVRLGGGGAFVLIPLAAERSPTGHVNAGQLGFDHACGLLLMLRVGIGVHKRHRHRLHASVTQRVAKRLNARHIQRRDHPALVVHALFKLKTQLPRHQRWIASVIHLKGHGPIAPADLDDIPEASGGHQGRAGAGTLQERVDDVCGAVLEQQRLRQ